jgi:hypothetical protein
MNKKELVELVKECIDEVLKESVGYYNNELKYIVKPKFELHGVDVDEDRGDIELEFTYNKSGDTYSISYNHFNDKMDLGIALKGDKNYKTISSDEFRKSDYHDPVYTVVELELDNLSRFINEEPDDRDYEDNERLGRMGYSKDQAN